MKNKIVRMACAYSSIAKEMTDALDFKGILWD